MESSTEKSGDELQNNPNHILYISNIPKTTKKEQLYQLLLPFGHVNSLNIIYRGQFAFAFAEFDDMRDAAAAVKDLNQINFNKRKLRVQFKNKKQGSAHNPALKKQKSNCYSEKNCKQEKQCQTQISLGQNQKSRRQMKESGESLGRKQYSRERSRQKKHRKDEGRSNKFHMYESRVEGRYSSREREYRNEKKKIEIDSDQLGEIMEDLLFVESRISRIYEKLDRLIYIGKKERSCHRNSH